MLEEGRDEIEILSSINSINIFRSSMTPSTDAHLRTAPDKGKNIYCQYLNIQLNQQERKDICNTVKQLEYIPAIHVFSATELQRGSFCPERHLWQKKTTNSQMGVKYASVRAADTKGYPGNRNEIEEFNEALKQFNEVLKQEQLAFLASRP